MSAIYKQRVELNTWEITGIGAYLFNTFNIKGVELLWGNKALHYDFDDARIAIYKISKGDDLYVTVFYDDSEDLTYRLDLGTDKFHHVSDDFITSVEPVEIF